MGFAVAALAQQQGAHVTITGRSQEKLAEASKTLKGIRTVAGQIGNEGDVERVFAELPAVDHVYLAAGGLEVGKLADTPNATLARAVDERIWGTIYTIRHASRRMTGGSITLMPGVRGDRPLPGTSMITAMVSAVEGFTRALALELAPVRANALAPGWIDTPLVTAVLGPHKEAVLTKEANALPTKRIGTVYEAAEAVLFLMTNGFMTGEVLHLDGGGRLI
jgi:NAD(P)-dependent dehydrogenase (short-subunit alcohol dehydrogenase family)